MRGQDGATTVILHDMMARFSKLEIGLDWILAVFAAVCFLVFAPDWLGRMGDCTFGNAASFDQVSHCEVSFVTPLIFTIQFLEFLVITFPAIFLSLVGLYTKSVFIVGLLVISILILCDFGIKIGTIHRSLTPKLAMQWALLFVATICIYPCFVAISAFRY